MNQSLHNIACWAYWEGQETYMPGTYRHNAPWFEALTGMSLSRNYSDLCSNKFHCRRKWMGLVYSFAQRHGMCSLTSSYRSLIGLASGIGRFRYGQIHQHPEEIHPARGRS